MNPKDLFIDEKLPEPLNPKELNIYFEKMHNGDIKARGVIIEHNIKLVLHQVEKFFNNTPYEAQELVSVGIVGLIKSVDTFDTSKKIQFSSYSSTCIHNEILMFIRKSKKFINDGSLDYLISVDKDGNELMLQNTLIDESVHFESDYEQKEEQKILREIIARLPKRDQEILMLQFGFIDDKRMSQDELAKKFNLSQSSISRITKNNLQYIKRELEKYEVLEMQKNQTEKKLVKRSKEDNF